MVDLRATFLACVVFAALCVAGALTSMTCAPVAAAWFVVGFFTFGLVALLVKQHAEARVRPFGPHHKPGCRGILSHRVGSGWQRTRVCSCGAEDHDPEFPSSPYDD